MARYKKRPGFDQPLPGLFDNLEGNSLFPEIEPLPIHPSISEAARREASKALHGGTAKQRRELFANDDFITVALNAYFCSDFFFCASSVLNRVFYEYVFAFFVQRAALRTLFALRTLRTSFTCGTLFAYSTVGTISTIFTGSAVLTLQRFEPFFHRTSKPIINCELISRFPIFTATSKSKRKAQCKHC